MIDDNTEKPRPICKLHPHSRITIHDRLRGINQPITTGDAQVLAYLSKRPASPACSEIRQYHRPAMYSTSGGGRALAKCQ